MRVRGGKRSSIASASSMRPVMRKLDAAISSRSRFSGKSTSSAAAPAKAAA